MCASWFAYFVYWIGRDDKPLIDVDIDVPAVKVAVTRTQLLGMSAMQHSFKQRVMRMKRNQDAYMMFAFKFGARFNVKSASRRCIWRPRFAIHDRMRDRKNTRKWYIYLVKVSRFAQFDLIILQGNRCLQATLAQRYAQGQSSVSAKPHFFQADFVAEFLARLTLRIEYLRLWRRNLTTATLELDEQTRVCFYWFHLLDCDQSCFSFKNWIDYYHLARFARSGNEFRMPFIQTNRWSTSRERFSCSSESLLRKQAMPVQTGPTRASWSRQTRENVVSVGVHTMVRVSEARSGCNNSRNSS